MKWLIAFPKDGETDAAIAEGCRNNGIEYDMVDARRYPHHLWEQMLAKSNQYDAVMMSRTMELAVHHVRCKLRYPDVKYMCWNPDTRTKLEDWGPLLSMFREMDYYFMMDKTDTAQMRDIQPNTYYLPQGIHEERYHPVEPTFEDRMKYGCDVSFIGSIVKGIHTERSGVIQALQDSHFDFKMFDNVWGEEHNKAVMCSKINLSCAHSPEKIGYFSVRNYKAIACGGIVLDLFHEEVDRLFGDACHYFTTPIEAVQKVGEILGNYKECKEKAEAFTKIAMVKHTYSERISRVKALLETGKFEEY